MVSFSRFTSRLAGGFAALVVALALILEPSASVASENSESEKIAADLANPLAPITTFTAQQRIELGNGPDDKINAQTRLQPSLFKPLSAKQAFLLRSIVPFRVNQWPTSDAGLGDINLVPYFVPDMTRKTFAGFGGALIIPTATKQALGSGKWSAGPAAIVAVTGRPTTWGGLVQQVWSFAGSQGRADVNVTTLQPFATVILERGWSLSFSSESTYNWEASVDRWTIPLSLGASKVINIGGKYMSVSVVPVHYAVRPTYAPQTELRVNATYVFR